MKVTRATLELRPWQHVATVKNAFTITPLVFRAPAHLATAGNAHHKAFLVAGAEACVMSLWKVPDQATETLMRHFYTALLEGTPRAEALRAAQKQASVVVSRSGRSSGSPPAAAKTSLKPTSMVRGQTRPQTHLKRDLTTRREC